jgi:WD40 repeat protein
MRPPWPNTTLNFGGANNVRAVAFSPCKSFLACGSRARNMVHVWDRHGEQTRLEGPTTGGVTCLQYSLDGRYLASGSSDNSIRLWCMLSEAAAAHSSASDESRSRGTNRGPLQAQSDITLLIDGRGGAITSLVFSPPDSDLLASGSTDGKIRLWDVINQVCIHAFNPGLWRIETIFFSPGDNIQCYVVTRRGPMIRIVKNKRMEFASTILEEPSLGKSPHAAFSACGTCFAAISYMASGRKWELALFDLRTMAKIQSVFLSGGRDDFDGIAMSPDGKKLATTNRSGGGALIFECHDLTIQKAVDNLEQRSDETVGFWPVAFDPTSRFFAVGCPDGKVKLRRTI